ncbi:MAG: sugar-binding transcriptional regulator [Lachnospiraceae bacterium]|nr:sugar-binding transcriptional regulator [Lachnospiraceae bacterium]
MKRNGEEDLEVIAEIARMYYLEGMTQAEIARMFYFSKAKVSRALQTAREKNIVEFRINYPLKRSRMLENELKRRFHLSEVLVVSDFREHQDADIYLKRLGEMAASYLDEVLKDGDTIGVSWGRTLYQVVRALNPSRPRRIEVLQLVGSAGETYYNKGTDIVSLVQTMAQSFQGTYTLLYAPMYINSDVVRKELLREGIISKTIEKICKADYILTGIADISLKKYGGTWAGYLTEEKKQELVGKGAVGYMCGYFFDKKGNLLADPINEKLIGIPFEKVKNGPRVIAVAGGLDKTYAIYAALRGKLIDCLITDSRIAENLLQL